VISYADLEGFSEETVEAVKYLTRPVNVADWNKTELDAELEKGYADMVEGRHKAATQVFAEMNLYNENGDTN
jgi:hypothetical protein